MMQLHFNICPLFTVSPQCFRPAPKVESAIIRLRPMDECPINMEEHADFESLIKQAFSQRRKTLRNTLKNTCTVAQLEAAGIDPGKRPQELGVNDYIALFRQL
jgi:16S rRNA (adenine1518-N6/adenine1519-N6)-dimethyltransferase